MYSTGLCTVKLKTHLFNSQRGKLLCIIMSDFQVKFSGNQKAEDMSMRSFPFPIQFGLTAHNCADGALSVSWR